MLALPLPFAVKTVFLLTELEEDASANAVGDNIADDGEIGLVDVLFRELLFDVPSIEEPAMDAGEHIFNVVVSGWRGEAGMITRNPVDNICCCCGRCIPNDGPATVEGGDDSVLT